MPDRPALTNHRIDWDSAKCVIYSDRLLSTNHSGKLQSRTIILGTFDTSEDGTPSPVQCCTNHWLFGQKIAHFLVFSTLQRGEGGKVGKVSQDYWPTLCFTNIEQKPPAEPLPTFNLQTTCWRRQQDRQTINKPSNLTNDRPTNIWLTTDGFKSTNHVLQSLQPTDRWPITSGVRRPIRTTTRDL